MATTTYTGPGFARDMTSVVNEIQADRRKSQMADLAAAMEEEKLKRAQMERQEKEMVMNVLQGVMAGGRGTGPGTTNIDPNQPQEFSNISPEGSYQQGGKGDLGQSLRDQPNMLTEAGTLQPGAQFQGQDAMSHPLVKKHLFGNAFGEFPEDKARREMQAQEQYMKRLEKIELGKAKIAEEGRVAAEGRENIRQDAAMKREQTDNYARAVAQHRTNRDVTIRDLQKQKIMWGGDKEKLAQIKESERDAHATYRIHMKNTAEAYRIQSIANGLTLPSFESEDFTPVEIEGMDMRLQRMNPAWLATKQNYDMPSILKIAKKMKKDPDEILAMIEQEYQASGGKFREWKTR